MKRVIVIVVGLVVLAAVLSLPNALSPAKALTPATPPVSPGASEYLIALPRPDLRSLEVPPHMTRWQALDYAHDLTFQQAESVVAELQRQKASGQIVNFEVRPEYHAVAVRFTSRQNRLANASLQQLASRGFVMPAGSSQVSCATRSAQALSEQVLALSRQSDRGQVARPSGGGGTNPSIAAYVPPAGVTGDYNTSFEGYTNANSPVAMRILRNGQVIATGSTTSSSGGYYSFYPDWQDCPNAGYSWQLKAGDMIEVTAAGNTVSTTVVNITAWVDPVANVVGGVTAPGRTVNALVSYYGSDLCSSSSRQLSTPADSSGNFNLNFTAVADFDRTANAYVYVYDSNANSTYYDFYAYYIEADFDDNYIYGYLKPSTPFTATLRRGGMITGTNTGTTNATGNYYTWFNTAIVAGDIISITGGTTTIQFTAAPLNNFAINTVTNQATGNTTPGRRVAGGLSKRTSGYVRTTCSSFQRWCHSVIADGTGNFALTAGGDLVRGDYVYLTIYDAEGNYQYGRYNSPAIVANLGTNQIQGYWRDPYTYLTIILKNSSDTVKETRSSVYANYEGRYLASLYSSTIVPGDKIEVGNGGVTETMTVQNLTARLDGGSGHLTGSASNGSLLAQLWGFRRENGNVYSKCNSATVTGGNYDLTFSGAQPGAQDYANAYGTGADGHYTRSRNAYAFSINATKDSIYQGQVWGYSETPYANITITLKSGPATKTIHTGTTISDGYYSTYLNTSINQGDTLQVQTNDGDNATISIPELTVNKEAGANRLFGRAPANEYVTAGLYRKIYDPYTEDVVNWYLGQVTATSSTADYSASFSGRYWGYDCSAAQVGHPCVYGQVIYYNLAGHSVKVFSPLPPPVSADPYENDDILATASRYNGIQHHTFHVVTDTDWITFTVPAQDVINAVQYRLASLNVGAGVSSQVILYATDGTTQLASTYTYDGGGFTLLFTPAAAGTYSLNIRQSDSYFVPYCDAVYDLLIIPERSKVYLPLIRR